MKLNRNIIKCLQKYGVDTRFVSLVNDKVFINNLKLSRFSRKKEEEFLKIYPQIEVVRSKIFQKICTRASRNLAHVLKPQEKIYLVDDNNPLNFAVKVILEPYSRKYGIQLIYGKKLEDANDIDADSIANPITLDYEVKNMLKLMLNGEKINLISSNETFWDKRMIYPLINIYEDWIYAWLGKQETTNKDYESQFLNFLESIIPGVRENMFKSALFVLKG